MHYPNGKIYQKKIIIENNRKNSKNSANRGMDLESDINQSNEYYKLNNICLITKRPTPINVVKVDYSKGARITNAYFEKQSTTDYNGVYKGKYIDFEVKNTKSKTSFPLSNISPHQIDHLKNVLRNDGIAFFIIKFELLNKVYLLDAYFVISFYENRDRASIPLSIFKTEAVEIKQGYNPRLEYIDAIIEKYFRN